MGIQDGAVVGVSWPLPSYLASSPLSILNAHSSFSIHTPVVDMIEWAILYLIDVVNVVISKESSPVIFVPH